MSDVFRGIPGGFQMTFREFQEGDDFKDLTVVFRKECSEEKF